MPIRFFSEKGEIADRDYDLIASFASLLDVHPKIVRDYVGSLAPVLAPAGVLWLNHGLSAGGDKIKAFANEAGLIVVGGFDRAGDAISVMKRNP